MKHSFAFIILVMLSGCSKLVDSWTCVIMSGHENVIFETKLNLDSRQTSLFMINLAEKENMMFGSDDVEIVTHDRYMVRKQIEVCNRNVQLLADNFQDKNSFRIYVRAPSNPMNEQTRRMIKLLSSLKSSA